VAINFLDYKWSRHDLSFGDCITEFKNNFLNFTLAGLIVVGLLSIPGINIISLPVLVVVFSLRKN